MARLVGLVLLLALGASLLVPGVAHGCSCAGPLSEDEAFLAADAVVIGRIVRVDLPWSRRLFAFSGAPDTAQLLAIGLHRNSIRTVVAVDETLEGDHQDLLTITSPIAVCCDCSRGRWSRPGERHLLYLHRGRGGFVADSWCARLRDPPPKNWVPPPTRLETQTRLTGPLPTDLPSLLWTLLLVGLLAAPGLVSRRRGATPSAVLTRTLLAAFLPLLAVAGWAIAVRLPPTPPPFSPWSLPFGPSYWGVLFWGKEMLVASAVTLGGLAFWRPLRAASPHLALFAGVFIAGAAVLDAQNTLSLSWVLDGGWDAASSDAVLTAAAVAEMRGRGVTAIVAALVLGGAASMYVRRRVATVRVPWTAQLALAALLLLSAATVRSWDRQLRQPCHGGHALTAAPSLADSHHEGRPFPQFRRPVAVIDARTLQAEQGAIRLPARVAD